MDVIQLASIKAIPQQLKKKRTPMKEQTRKRAVQRLAEKLKREKELQVVANHIAIEIPVAAAEPIAQEPEVPVELLIPPASEEPAKEEILVEDLPEDQPKGKRKKKFQAEVQEPIVIDPADQLDLADKAESAQEEPPRE
jgi:hypothetical protein